MMFDLRWSPAWATVFLTLGLISGSIHFAMLRWTTSALCRAASGRLMLRVALGTAGRFALTLLLAWWAARHGASALLAYGLGFGLGRTLMLRRAQREPTGPAL